MGGYDCVLLPGAMTKSSAIKYPAMCGGVGGLVTATSTIAKTLCSKLTLLIKVSVANYVFNFLTSKTENYTSFKDISKTCDVIKQPDRPATV